MNWRSPLNGTIGDPLLILHFARATAIALASSVALAACSTTPHEGTAAAARLAYTQSGSTAAIRPAGGKLPDDGFYALS